MDPTSIRRRRNLHATTSSTEDALDVDQSEIKNIRGNGNGDQITYFFTRIILIRFIAFIYSIAFIIAYNQNINLLGKNGLKPANRFMQKFEIEFQNKEMGYDKKNFKLDQSSIPFITSLGDKFQLFLHLPTFFWFFDYETKIDELLMYTSMIGGVMSILVLITGRANSLIMLTLWILYHGIVNIGQTWYSFGWESQLLESGFISIFLVPFFSLNMTDSSSPPSLIPIVLYRWLIFRIMLGAGLIKIRGDPCWRDLTCMNYFYQTQPVPNPISYFLHKTPEAFHKFEVLANHLIELVAPFLIVMPLRKASIFGGLIQIKFQVVLIIAGNLAFLNWLTILPALACIDDRFYACLFSKKVNILKQQTFKIYNVLRRSIDMFLLCLVVYLSYPVLMNLISPTQAMNTSFEPFRIVNTYGAFGSVTKIRHEIIIKGTYSKDPVKNNPEWFEYEFKCKPGSVDRMPCVISPYHYRLDWLMWFAPFQNYQQHPWLISLCAKFLLNDVEFTDQMIAANPFRGKRPPKFVKADLYVYEFGDGNNNSDWWSRRYHRNYIPPISLEHVAPYIKDLAWNL